MFENLSERLENSFRLIKGQGRITEVNISEIGSISSIIRDGTPRRRCQL